MGQECTVRELRPGIWQLNEAGENGPYVDAYLICGTAKALVVDCLETAENLYEEVRRITPLPVELVITHGHGDHAGAGIRQFKEAGCPVYMSLEDLPLLSSMFGKEYPKGYFCELRQGMRFDLGGFLPEVISVPGHTKGSVVLLDRKNRLLFSGDSIGSGNFWMQIPGTLPLADFLPRLQALYDEVKGLPDLEVFPGHRSQMPKEMGLRYVEDVLSLTKHLVDGTMEGEDEVLDFAGIHMEYKKAGFGLVKEYCYNPKTIFGPDPAPYPAPCSAEGGSRSE